ncbi:MAG: AAA family ATPase [Parvularculaceae bacterium]|nr:AAA family ATPase [Parvularculaceae bacterium]
MAYLHYGLRQAEGFVVITGEIGAGKSILIGRLLDQLDRSSVVAATLATPNLTPENLLSHVLSAFRIEPAGESDVAEIEAFEDFLFDQLNHGRRVLLIVDEAQNLPLNTLEELRILSNLEYEGTPLFQVFLIGQPDFRETMARADMEQLRQRVIATYHLTPLSREETEKYIEHRLKLVGWTGAPAIAAEAYDRIFGETGGLPRKIHRLCDRALLYCSVEKIDTIDAAAIGAVLSDLSEEQSAGENANAARDDAKAERESASEEGAAAAPIATPPPTEKIDQAISSLTTQSDEQPANTPQNVFDRLRAKRMRGGDAAEGAEPPRPATLDDVANAIAAARIDTPQARADLGDLESESAPPPAPVSEISEGWKKSVVMSINETRDELQRAHRSVEKLRKQVLDMDKRRSKRRSRIVASLDRAEALLTEIQNAWR